MSDDEAAIRELLGAETIAVIGCSTTPGKAAHDVPAYLQRNGYRLVPINPHADEILGEHAYDALGAVEEEIDVVDVFRPSEAIPGVVDEVLERTADRGDVWGLWIQLGIEHDEAVARAAEAGITVVQDRCIKIEHARMRSSPTTE